MCTMQCRGLHAVTPTTWLSTTTQRQGCSNFGGPLLRACKRSLQLQVTAGPAGTARRPTLQAAAGPRMPPQPRHRPTCTRRRWLLPLLTGIAEAGQGQAHADLKEGMTHVRRTSWGAPAALRAARRALSDARLCCASSCCLRTGSRHLQVLLLLASTPSTDTSAARAHSCTHRLCCGSTRSAACTSPSKACCMRTPRCVKSAVAIMTSSTMAAWAA